MLYSIKNREDLQKLNESSSLESQVKAVRLQDKLDKENFHEDLKKVFEPVTKSIKDVSDEVLKTMTEQSINNNRPIENLKEKNLELMIDKCMIALYLASSLVIVNFFKPENKSQFRLIKDLHSSKMNDFIVNEGIPVTLVSNMLTFGDSNKSFKLDGVLLKIMTNIDFIVSHSNPNDQKLIYEFGKEMNFNIKQKGRKSDGDKSLIKLLKSPAILASGLSTIFLPSNPDELCDRLKFLQQAKQAGNNSVILNEEIVAIVDKLLEYRCIPKKYINKFRINVNYFTRLKSKYTCFLLSKCLN